MMTEGEKAGLWAMIYLIMIFIATWWTIACITWYHIKEWFL